MGQNGTKVRAYGTTEVTDKRFQYISNKLRLMDTVAVELKYTFVVIDKHPQMVVFAEYPEYDDDSVVSIDLVYDEDKDTKERKNVVRFQVV